MKKKNVLMMALSLCLVAVIAVGGTLAYLTDSDGKVVNTFTFADGLEVSLTEAVPTEGLDNASATSRSDGQKGVMYGNVVIGQTLPKEPKIQLTQATVTTYVFAKIENKTNGMVTVGTVDTGVWTDCGADDDGNKIYGREVVATNGVTNDTATALFSNVSITGEPAEGTSLGDIIIYVSAIQAEGFDDIHDALDSVTEWEAA